MLAVPVFNMQGERTGEMQIDPAVLGGEVRPKLVKQAIVTTLDRRRQDDSRRKGRSDVAGSTRKLYRQKGTGNARMGTIRTCIRKGGGVAFAKRAPGRRLVMPRKMRRLARDSALLAKIKAEQVLVVDGLACEKPRSKVIASLLKAIGADRGCVLTLDAFDRNIYLSGRNLVRTEVRVLDDLNAYEIMRRNKVVFTRPAFGRLAGLEES